MRRQTPQLPAGNVYEIFFDSEGRGWVCAEGRHGGVERQQPRADRFPEGFANKLKIRGIYAKRQMAISISRPTAASVFGSNMALTSFSFLHDFSTSEAPPQRS